MEPSESKWEGMPIIIYRAAKSGSDQPTVRTNIGLLLEILYISCNVARVKLITYDSTEIERWLPSNATWAFNGVNYECVDGSGKTVEVSEIDAAIQAVGGDPTDIHGY